MDIAKNYLKSEQKKGRFIWQQLIYSAAAEVEITELINMNAL